MRCLDFDRQLLRILDLEGMMADGITPESRKALVDALLELARAVEVNPPPIIGSDIFVQAGPRSQAVGSSISVTAGPGGGTGVGQRIDVVAHSGQSVIGQRITVVAGEGTFQPQSSGASSQNEISDAVTQLRDAASALTTSNASESWISGILTKVSGWGSAALSGAVSGATNATMKFYLTGS